MKEIPRNTAQIDLRRMMPQLVPVYKEMFFSKVKEEHPYPGGFSGRGIVICAGGQRYFPCAYVCINMLRDAGCTLPIELWHMDSGEMSEEMKDIIRPFGVACVNAGEVRVKHPVRIMNSYEIKPYSIIHSKFQEVLLLDADNVPLKNPEFLFDTEQYRETGAIFWPDYSSTRVGHLIWEICSLNHTDDPEFESGQIVLDKSRCWKELQVTMFMNDNSDFFYRVLLGDKDTFRMAWKACNRKYSLIPHPIRKLPKTMVQHDFTGIALFQHRNASKWRLPDRKGVVNPQILGFEKESRCLNLLKELFAKWDGRINKEVSKSSTNR